eukprot:GEZU01018733.1.p1 GENE.GEZU01018733.1~~GEZU01018733.1.p1  ORF type:complete len:348 (+),score=104.30 GEZU01018733.1:122-1165(+)
MSNLGKNFALLKQSALQKMGMAERTKTPDQLHMLYEDFKVSIEDYKKTQLVAKQFAKALQEIAAAENQLGKLMDNYGHHLTEQTEERAAKRALTTDELSDELHKYSQLFGSLQTLRFQMLSIIDHECVAPLADTQEGTKAGREAKAAYDKARLEHDDIRNTLATYTRENLTKSKDYSKKMKLEEDIIRVKENLDIKQEEAITELDYQVRKMNAEYQTALRSLMYSYYCYFETGYMLFKNLEVYLERPRERNTVERPEKKKVEKPVEELPVFVPVNIENTKVYGTSLEEVLARPTEPGPIPRVFEQLAQFVEQWGYDSEGIFRVPGNDHDIKVKKRLFDKGRLEEEAE